MDTQHDKKAFDALTKQFWQPWDRLFGNRIIERLDPQDIHSLRVNQAFENGIGRLIDKVRRDAPDS